MGAAATRSSVSRLRVRWASPFKLAPRPLVCPPPQVEKMLE